MAWKLGESHKWIMRPYTSYEIRRELRVRESRHTVMIFDKKYFDCDTGKFNSDKLNTINSYSLAEMTVDDYDGMNAETTYRRRYRAESDAWFVPKDNDFDEECRREEEAKKKQEEESIKAERYLTEFNRRVKEAEEKAKKEKEAKEELDKMEREYKENAYREYVKMREVQLERARRASQPASNGQYIITWSGKRRVG